MITILQNWLKNTKRDYSEGVQLFNNLANDQQKKDFANFFNEGLSSSNISQFDIRFTTLINQLSFTLRAIQRNPQLFKSIKTIDPKVAKKQPAETKSQQPVELDSLPEEFAQDILRLKEIVPIMARVHAEMSISDIAPDKRAGLRNELIELDKERRAIWERIDKYNIDGEIEKTDEELQLEENLLLEGANIAKRIAQLRSNITRNTNSVKDFTKKGDKKKAAAAQARLDEYKRELSELELLLDEQ